MKRTFAFIAFILSLVGCAKETFVDSSVDADGGLRDGGLRIIADVSKTAYADAGNDGLKTTWLANDAIGVYAYKQHETEPHYWLNFKAVADSDAEVASFTIKEGYILAHAGVDYKIYAYYPYNSSVEKVESLANTPSTGSSDPSAFPITVAASQSQKSAGDCSHLATYDFLYGYAVNRYIISNEETKKIYVNFHHALSVLEVALTSAQSGLSVSSVTAMIEDENEIFSISEGSINLETGELAPVAGTSSISVNLLESATLSETPSKVYIQITPGHAGKVLSIYAYVNGNKQKVGSVKVPSTGIPAGVKASLAFDVEEQAVADDYIDLSTEGTANCYIVNQPGKIYRFKATEMGNGKLPAKLASELSTGTIDPQSALVLWYAPLSTSIEDVTNAVARQPILVESVKIKDGYIYFSTPDSFIDGNVVIAAFAEEGLTYDNITVDSATREFTNATVLWSWNLWCVEGYDINAPENQLTFGSTILADRNLGALLDGSDLVYDKSNPSEAYRASYVVGNLYQFGRKDPSPSFYGYTSYSVQNITYYEPNFTPIIALQQASRSMFINGGVNRISTDGSASLSEAVVKSVANPHLIMTANNFTYGWTPVSANLFRHLWGGEDKTASFEKTAYDPCPVGWKLWDAPTADTVIKAVDADESKYFKANGIYSLGTCFPFSATGRDSVTDKMKATYLMPYVSWPDNGVILSEFYTGISTSTGLAATGGFMYEALFYMKTTNVDNAPSPTYYCDGFAYKSGNVYARCARPARCIKE